VHLAITRAETVLELRLAADGGLAAGAGPLDDAALTTALAAAFAKPVHHAITVRTAAGVGDDLVVAARKRLLAIASAAQVWAVPLFTAE
jgi:hypothetical protein